MDSAIILAGGQGKRMKSDLPKPMFKVLGEPMLDWVISACNDAEIDEIAVITGYCSEKIEEHLDGKYATYFQSERLGTGHAVMQAIPFIKKNADGNILVACGDAPFISAQDIKNSLEQHISLKSSATIITSRLDNPFGYGRIVRGANGVERIVEQKDADECEKAINEVNSGVFWFKAKDLLYALSEIKPNNSQGEYYLTDAIAVLRGIDKSIGAYSSSNQHTVKGANDRKGLLELNKIAREAIIDKHLENGVEFTCIDGITIERSVEIEAGAEILSGTILRGKTKIGKDSVIGPNCILENTIVGEGTHLNYVQSFDSVIEDNVKIGPFVHIRPDSVIKSGVKIGDFVEIKNSTIGEKTAVSHLTYVGDTDVGSQVNFGCGVVTVNYDGVNKHRSKIGNKAFIGCNTNIVSPVTIGECAYTAAGTTVTKDIPNNALAIDRSPLVIKEEYTTKKFRDKKWK